MGLCQVLVLLSPFLLEIWEQSLRNNWTIHKESHEKSKENGFF